MNKNKVISKNLETKASDFLNSTFTLVDYTEDADYPNQYAVRGIIQRYGKPANVLVHFEKKELRPVYWSITDDTITLPTKRIGRMELGKDVCVSDPCYDRDVWCMTQLHNVKPGAWDVEAGIGEIDSWGERVYVLTLYHHSIPMQQRNKLEWSEYGSLGVDSGQMSVFDDHYYRRKNGSVEEFESDKDYAEAFYDNCCGITLGNDGVGLYYADHKAVGVVSSSGCGDGAYPMDVAIQNDEIVAIRIDFM